MTKINSELLANIPAELRTPPLWLQYYETRDPKKPEKKPGKHPCVKYSTPEYRKANLRALDDLLNRPKQAGFQRYVDKAEGFVFIDLDKVRNAESGEVEPWASELIEELASYTEISASGKGFHIVCRGELDEDFHLDPNQVEIYSGNIPNKLIAMTGDVYDLCMAIENRQEKVEQLLKRVKGGQTVQQLSSVPIDWRKRFHTVDELPDGDIRFLIENVLPEGVAFIGALSGAGKTWFCLSMARALTTGKKFLGNHTVPDLVEVLYLCPEMNAKTFKKRCRLFGINERFHCMTISDGIPLDLSEPVLAAAVTELTPVVFLDTAIRFTNVVDENSSSQNAQGLAKAVFALIHMGAQAVVCLHHRPKAGAGEAELTLENTLRGTGDLGAICDVVWGLQYEKGSSDQYAKESRKLVRLQVSCVKARDFVSPEDLRIQLSPFIDEIGDFAVLEGDPQTTESNGRKSEAEKVNATITANPSASLRRLEELTSIGRKRLTRMVEEAGWKQNPAGDWTQDGMLT